MLLLAFHIVTVGMLVVMVSLVAYRVGYHKAERRLARRLREAGITLPEADSG